MPRLFGWDIHQNDKFFLTFLVATHLATAIVLFFFFLKDWMRIFRGLGRSLRDREIAPGDNDARLGWLLIVERLRTRPPRPGDYLGDSDARIAKLSWRQAIAVGTAQAAALIPGISRSGITMGGGILVGLSNEDAARYGFLLATPIIGAAAALKVPELFGSAGNGVRGPALVAALCAAATTFFAVKFLLKYFETNRLTPFGIYCIVAGTALTIGFALT